MDSRGLGIGMAFVVLAAASYFSRESFWEEAWTGAKREDTRLIMIDAGHGGNDPGKVGVDGVLEKDLNLQLAKKLKTLLEQQDTVLSAPATPSRARLATVAAQQRQNILARKQCRRDTVAAEHAVDQ